MAETGYNVRTERGVRFIFIGDFVYIKLCSGHTLWTSLFTAQMDNQKAWLQDVRILV